MNSVPDVALGEVAQIVRQTVDPTGVPGDTAYVGLDDIDSGGRLKGYSRTGDSALRSTKFGFEAGDVLFGKLRPYLAKVATPGFAGICSTDILPIRSGPHIRSDYLALFLRHPRSVAWAAQRATGANLPRIGVAQIEDLSIPLPPLEVQRHIAEVLIAAKQLHATRAQVLSRFDLLANAILHRLLDSGPWPEQPLGELLARIDSGSSPVCSKEPAGAGEWGVLKLDAVSSGSYRPGENKALLPGTGPEPRLEVHPEDVLLMRKNTPALVGKAVFVRRTPPLRLLPDLIFRLVPGSRATLDKRYLHAAISLPATQASIARLAGGAVASMVNISKARLKSTTIKVPPIDEQLGFAAQMAEVDNGREVTHRQLATLDALYSSLQSRAFKGGL